MVEKQFQTNMFEIYYTRTYTPKYTTW